MKKLCLLPCILFFTVSTSWAQQPDYSPPPPPDRPAPGAGVTIKPAVGINLTNVSKQPNGSAQAQVGWQIGGSVALGHLVYIEPGVFYVGKSTQFTSTAASSIARINLNGIRIPVSVGINLLGDNKPPVGVHVFGGGSVFIITSTSDDLPKSLVNTTSWGLHAGAGLDLFMFFLDLSYEWSLTNIQKDISDIDVGKTRTFFINAGVRIPL